MDESDLVGNWERWERKWGWWHRSSYRPQLGWRPLPAAAAAGSDCTLGEGCGRSALWEQKDKTQGQKTWKRSIRPGSWKQRSMQLQLLSNIDSFKDQISNHEVRWGFSRQHWVTNPKLTSGVALLCPDSLAFTSLQESWHWVWSSYILYIFCSPPYSCSTSEVCHLSGTRRRLQIFKLKLWWHVLYFHLSSNSQ